MIKGTIYLIYCNITGEIYVGSTTKTMHERLGYHKNKYNRCSSKFIIKRGNYLIDILETGEFEKLIDLRKREQDFLDAYNCINAQCAYVSAEDNRIKQIEMLQSKKECDFCKKKISIRNMARHVKINCRGY